MAVKLNDKHLSDFIGSNEYANIQPLVNAAHEMLVNKTGAGNDFLGWRTASCNYDKEEFARIKEAAKKIQKSCDVFIVTGIGGSYLGARAVIEFLKSPRYNNLKKDTPDIYFSGCNLSSSDMKELLEICEGKDVCINVISKSGTTTETAVAFRIFRDMLESKYGKDGAAKHIFVTTDKEKGTLRSFSDKSGYETFVVPDDMGGRYSVLSAVGLLPIAVAGIDIDELMAGAEAARTELTSADISKNDSYKYAAIRNILLRKGKNVEILVGYEPYLQMFSEWWKQLFGESEGKDNRGIYPSSVIFSTDLHSLGQYIQEGQRFLFETVMSIGQPDSEIVIPNDENNIDGLNFLSGKTLYDVNSTARTATVLAHNDGGVPNIVLDIKDRSAYSVGYMIYFFWLSCAISGYMLGVNPFDQPGVEAYKKNMFALLGKPGFEDRRAELEKRLK
ncbi:MAG: glucose-6-phosphate isomerase [Clostridia bacterium]|nr:glucose-6-phosphate isomerase [Clostridia bacterium]